MEAKDFEFEVSKLNICRLVNAERDENNYCTKENITI